MNSILLSISAINNLLGELDNLRTKFAVLRQSNTDKVQRSVKEVNFNSDLNNTYRQLYELREQSLTLQHSLSTMLYDKVSLN